MKKENEFSLEILRHFLGSIDFKDIEDKEMPENERKEYCATISAVFPRLEKDMKKFLHEQLIFAANNAQNWEQVLFARGTFNGISLLLDYWKKALIEHMTGGEEKFDKHSPVGQLE